MNVTPINIKDFMYGDFAAKKKEESVMNIVATASVAMMCFGMAFSQSRSGCKKTFWKQEMMLHSFTECINTTSVKSVARLRFRPKSFGLRPTCLRRAGLMLFLM